MKPERMAPLRTDWTKQVAHQQGQCIGGAKISGETSQDKQGFHAQSAVQHPICDRQGRWPRKGRSSCRRRAAAPGLAGPKEQWGFPGSPLAVLWVCVGQGCMQQLSHMILSPLPEAKVAKLRRHAVHKCSLSLSLSRLLPLDHTSKIDYSHLL